MRAPDQTANGGGSRIPQDQIQWRVITDAGPADVRGIYGLSYAAQIILRAARIEFDGTRLDGAVKERWAAILLRCEQVFDPLEHCYIVLAVFLRSLAEDKVAIRSSISSAES